MGLTKKFTLLLGNQGGASMLPFTDDFARDDGDVGNGWLYSAGVWTISSNQLVVNPTPGPTINSNSDMELGDPPTGWSAQFSATLSAVADERDGGSGSKSLKALRGSLSIMVEQSWTSVWPNGRWGTVGAWLKNVSATSAAYCYAYAGLGYAYPLRSAAASWTQKRAYMQRVGSSYVVYLGLDGSAGQEARFDDVTAQLYDTSDLLLLRDVGTPNVSVSTTITKGEGVIGDTGVVLCVDDPSTPGNLIAALFNDTKARLEKMVAGIPTYLFDLTIPYSAGAEIKLEQRGGLVRMFYGGRQIGSEVRVTDAGIVSNTYAGLFGMTSDNTHGAATLETAGAFVALDGDPDAVFAVTTAAANLWATSGSDDWLGRPVLADDGSKWIAIYRAATGHSEAGAGKFHVRFSEDEGANWTAEDTFTDSSAVTGAPFAKHGSSTDVGDAIVFVAPNGDILVHAYEGGDATTHGTYQYRSTDGGATFVDEGLIDDGTGIGGQDYTIVGTDIYITIMADANKDRNHPWVLHVYKSSDSGTNWTDLGAIDAAHDCNEPGIIHTGGNNLLIVMRSNNDEGGTWYYTSADLGLTWSARQTMPTAMSKLQRPRMKAFAGGILLYGRDYFSANVCYTTIWYSPDGGVTWGRKFLPDIMAYADAAYCDVLERADGKFYMLSYGGSTAAAAVRSMVFEIA